MKNDKELLHIVNTDSHVMWDVMIDCFQMSAEEQKKELNIMFNELQDYLQKVTKGQIEYQMFRKVLYPFSSFFMYVFDTSMIEDTYYGYEIKSKLINVFDKKSNALFLSGDYIVKPNNHEILKKLFIEKSIDVTNWSNMTQYYLVCVMGISTHMAETINGKFLYNIGYCGYSDLTMDSTKLKSYLGMTIPQSSIKIRNKLFFSVPDGEEDLELNYSGFDFEDISKLKLQLVPVPESLYLMFLTSRPQTLFMEEKEFNNSIKMFDKDISYSDSFSIKVPKEKIKYFKTHIDLSISEKVLKNKIKHAVNLFQISHINSLGDKLIKFNVPMEYRDKLYILSLKWDFKTNQISIITIVPN